MDGEHERLAEPLNRVLAGRALTDGTLAVAIVAPSGVAPLTRVRGQEPLVEPRFLIYSVTKTFIAGLLMLLKESGELDPDDVLARWQPLVPGAERITLRMLSNHTAGIPDYGGLAAYNQALRDSPTSAWSFQQYAAETFEKGLLFEPGEGWEYSNPGYMLLRSVLEDVSGTAFAQLVTDRITAPLGLGNTSVVETIADLADLAPAESEALTPDGTHVDVRDRYDPGWVSHGVIASTASDVARFFDALFSLRLVNQASLDEMVAATRIPATGSEAEPATRPYAWREPSYGLGLMIDRAAPWGAILGHNGGGPGYSASVFHAPGLGGATACALVSGAQGFSANDVVFDVFDELRDG